LSKQVATGAGHDDNERATADGGAVAWPDEGVEGATLKTMLHLAMLAGAVVVAKISLCSLKRQARTAALARSWWRSSLLNDLFILLDRPAAHLLRRAPGTASSYHPSRDHPPITTDCSA